jgi:hypothetical protein
MTILKSHVLLAALLVALAQPNRLFAAESGAPEPLAGETLLTAAETEKILAELSAFKDPHPLKAHIRTETADELLGARIEEGELLLDRPARVLRKFTKPSVKIWLLDGAKLSEYGAKSKKLYVKDFSQAPRALKLIQAAFTGDLTTLKELFDVYAFKGSSGGQTIFRFVLNRKSGGDSPALYKRIQARLYEKGLFFHEIEYLPESGDRVLERYTEIESVGKPADKDFVLDIPDDVVRKTEVIGK